MRFTANYESSTSDSTILSLKSLPSAQDLETSTVGTLSRPDTIESFTDVELDECIISSVCQCFDCISPCDFKCEIAVFAPECFLAPADFEAHWHATAASLEALIREDYGASIDIVLIVADVMEESQFAACQQAIRSFEALGDVAPPMVLLPHAPDGFGNWESLQTRWIELLEMGLEDVCSTQLSGFDLPLWVRCFVSTQQTRLQRVENALKERRRLAGNIPVMKRANETIMWDYIARRVAPALPVSDARLAQGIPRSLDGFEFKQRLGSGGFGSVYLVQRESEPVEVVKALEKKQFKSLDDVRNVGDNVKLMKWLSIKWPHKNVVQFHAAYQSASHLFFRCEFAGHHNLCHRLKLREASADRRPCALSLANTRMVISQLASALSHLHDSPHVCHRDLKPENVIVFYESEDNIEIKLADFDMAVVQPSGHLCQGVCGTFPFFAPELLVAKGYDGMAADVWSLGVMLLEVQCFVGVLEQTFCGTSRDRGVEEAMEVHSGLAAPSAVASVLERKGSAELNAFAATALKLAEGMLAQAPEQRWSASTVSDFLLASTLRRCKRHDLSASVLL